MTGCVVSIVGLAVDRLHLFAYVVQAAAMKTGDQVWIGCDDRTVEGVIITASENGRSLMLGFEAILDGHFGMMPVLLQDGVYRSIVTGEAIAVVPRSPVT